VLFFYFIPDTTRDNWLLNSVNSSLKYPTGLINVMGALVLVSLRDVIRPSLEAIAAEIWFYCETLSAFGSRVIKSNWNLDTFHL
jgi:hypothetical protein